ncbi:acylphosphatase [Bifidobacterium olomucense]|uniref:Acylphosphatase n=1 Tax=Bifidobacterium olomucense TaxID=2675324 RepID=A0A7Y0HV14_9BIFI|nr:acylphosphatase [Bifidobacterium sp. DSM 109959]NMM97785.1 acylphosphatase [Bifidobacterium sp. DSM 109959]
MNMVRKHIVVEGLVQGVGFRYFAVMQACKLGITGWVRNRRDGAVEVEAQGKPESMENFVSALRQGPRWAEVQHVSVTDMTPSDDASRVFSVRMD